MNLDKRINEIVKMLWLLSETEPIEMCTDGDWWNLRIYLMVANNYLPDPRYSLPVNSLLKEYSKN